MEELPPGFPRLDQRDGQRALWDYVVRQRDIGALSSTPELRFLGMCVARYPLSRAQLLQDLYVLWRLQDKRGGYFVEFGAMDGVFISNTAILEREFGWTGILSEPNPQWHAALAHNRTSAVDYRAVWGQTGQKVPFAAHQQNPELSAVGPAPDSVLTTSINVETVSLRDLLVEHRAPEIVDYLSVDTEGGEVEILKAFDFSYRFRVITVEHNFDPAARADIHALLTSHGYRWEFENFSRWDDWYFDPRLVP